jgi:hypothetical protein
MSSDSKAPGADQAPPFNWRKYLPVHPAAELFPLMSEAELHELAQDIKKNGLRTEIVTYSEADDRGRCLHSPVLLDGRNRLDALALLGLVYETPDHHLGLKNWTGKGWSDRGGRIEGQYLFDVGDPYALALSFNLHRRHLNAKQKRDLIAKVLKAKPEASNNSIGKQTGSDDKTVACVRRDLEGRSEIPNVEVRTDTKGRTQPASKPPKPGSGSPGFDTACEWAKRLGREVEQLTSGGFRLTSPDGAPVCFHSLKRLTQALKDVEAKAGAKATLAGDPGAEDAEASAAAMKAAHAAAEGGDDTERSGDSADADDRSEKEIAEHNRAALVIYACTAIDLAEKITSFADLKNITDEAKETIHRAAVAWAELAAKVETPPPDDTPIDPGPAPDGETDEKPTTEAQAPTDAISAVEEPTAPTGLIPDDLSIPPFMRRTVEASAPSYAPVPIEPPAPAPTPSPAPTPPQPKPKLTKPSRMTSPEPPQYPRHRVDPWPDNWVRISEEDLVAVICETQDFGCFNRETPAHRERRLKQLEVMCARLKVLRRADRAAERASRSSEAANV